MRCPQCNAKLDQALLANVEVDYCPKCYGMWFEEEELRWAKDERDRDLRWLDIDLWKDEGHFRISPSEKLCPIDRMPLYETRYGDSSIKVDVCNVCRGIWLDRGEFKEIVKYLREKADRDVLYHYLKTLSEETWEVFSGPELLQEELLDTWAVVKLLRYKFAAQHPTLSRFIASTPG